MPLFHTSLSSPRLVLRPLLQKDAVDLSKKILETLDDLHPWMDWAVKNFSLVEATQRIISHQSQWSDPLGSRAYGIFDIQTGVLIGEISAHHVHKPQGTVQLGYWMAKSHQKQALMREAVILMTRYLIDYQKFERVYIYCEDGNARSIQLPIALGFEKNPVLKGYTINLITHNYNDVHVFSRVSTDGLPDFKCVW